VRLAVIAGLLVSLVIAQEPAQQQPLPKFRTGVDAVLLDVTVLDRQRRPVRGLTASDFTVLEDGKPQPIVSFEELDSPEPDGSLVPWMREVAPDVRTNDADNRRIVVLVLDDGLISFRDRERVKDVGRRIVDQLGPADQVAVIYTGNNSKSQEFTNDRALLRRTIERFVDTTVGGSAMQNSIQTLKKVTQSLLALPNRRKAMIVVSPLAINFGDPNSDLGFQMQDALRHALRANVTIYPINPAGLEVPMVGGAAAPGQGGRTLASSVDAGADPLGDTARVMANETGGFAVTSSNTFDTQIRQIFRETGSYYLLGFQSAHTDGKFRRLEVRTAREGLTVRTRNGYEAAKPDKNAKSEKDSEPLALVKALATVLPTPDVPMRVVVAPFAGVGKRAVVTIALGVQQPAPPEGEGIAERVELLSNAFDMSYRRRAAYRQTVQLKLRAAEGSGDAKYEILSKLELDPGRYQLRFAARSALLGKSGSVYQDLEVPDFTKAPLSLSGVVLGVNPSLPSAPKDFLAAVVPVAPTTQRTFLKGHRPAAFLRVYQGGKKPPVPVTMTTTLVDERDQAVYSGTISLGSADFGVARAGDHRFDVPIDDLAPGAYLLRFEAAAGSQTASREVRFVVR
jgi:VWFA-related protein